jgi:hypothetical protein
MEKFLKRRHSRAMISYRANLFESLNKLNVPQLGDIVETITPNGIKIAGIVATEDGADIDKSYEGKKGYIYVYQFHFYDKSGSGLFRVPINSLKKIPGKQLPTRPKYSPGQEIGRAKILAVNYSTTDYHYLCDDRGNNRIWVYESDFDKIKLNKKANLFDSLNKQINPFKPGDVFVLKSSNFLNGKEYPSNSMWIYSHNNKSTGLAVMQMKHSEEDVIEISTSKIGSLFKFVRHCDLMGFEIGDKVRSPHGEEYYIKSFGMNEVGDGQAKAYCYNSFRGINQKGYADCDAQLSELKKVKE